MSAMPADRFPLYDPHATEDELLQCISTANILGADRFALHPNAGPRVWKRLLFSEDGRMGIIYNLKAPRALREALGRATTAGQVQFRKSEEHTNPEELIRSLTRDTSRYLPAEKKEASERLLRRPFSEEAIVELLFRDHPKAPYLVETYDHHSLEALLSKDEDKLWILANNFAYYVAANPNCSEQLQSESDIAAKRKRLPVPCSDLTHEEMQTRWRARADVAEAVPLEEVLQHLKMPRVTLAVFDEDATEEDLISELPISPPALVALHPNAGPRTWRLISCTRDGRKGLMLRPVIPDDLYSTLYNTSKEVRELVGHRRGTVAEVIQNLPSKESPFTPSQTRYLRQKHAREVGEKHPAFMTERELYNYVGGSDEVLCGALLGIRSRNQYVVPPKRNTKRRGYLSTTHNEFLMRETWNNIHNTPDSTESYQLAKGLSANPKCPDDILRSLWERNITREFLVENPSLPQDLLNSEEARRYSGRLLNPALSESERYITLSAEGEYVRACHRVLQGEWSAEDMNQALGSALDVSIEELALQRLREMTDGYASDEALREALQRKLKQEAPTHAAESLQIEVAEVDPQIEPAVCTGSAEIEADAGLLKQVALSAGASMLSQAASALGLESTAAKVGVGLVAEAAGLEGAGAALQEQAIADKVAKTLGGQA